MDDLAYAYLKRQISSLLGIEIDAYKGQQMRRRLENFIRTHAGDSPMPFLRRLSKDDGALQELRDMLTINVTEFFRDSPQFELLRKQVLPPLVAEGTRARLWSAGCSRGHEPYSLAIMLDELGAGDRSSIVATDLDREALKVARAGGPYTQSELRNVSSHQLRRYFTLDGTAYRVASHLAARVRFRELNLLTDAFSRGFDLIVCRNVMIYFRPAVKTALLQRFFQSLAPGGVLFIGGTEALIGEEVGGFERLGGNFYRRPPGQQRSRRAA